MLAEHELELAVYGYFIAGVLDDRCAPWLYTVGLLDTVGHPELIVAGVQPEAGAAVIHDLAERVMAGERFFIGEAAKASGEAVLFGAVDVAHYANDTFNQWHEMQRADVIASPDLEAVQVMLASSSFGSERGHRQPRLSSPDERVGARQPPPNRAVRRRRARRRS